jgi:hypothetical protein
MIIGISGYSGSGKDTVGMIIQYLNCTNKGELTIEDVCKDYKDHEWWLEDQSGWEIKKFAGKLKDIAEHLTGIDIEKFEDQEFKKTNLGPEWDVPAQVSLSNGQILIGKLRPLTVREFLQNLGTNAMRNGLHDNVWVNALFADYKLIEYGDDEQGHYPNWVVTDTRFPNEAKAIKEKDGIIIRVEKPGIEPINNHPSETGLDDWNFDYKIANVSGIFELKEAVQDILKHAKLL